VLSCVSAIFIFCVFGFNKLTIKYIKKLLSYKHTCNKPPDISEAFPQLAGDYPTSRVVTNILVFNNPRTWVVCFAIVLEFWRGWEIANGDVFKVRNFGLRKTVRKHTFTYLNLSCIEKKSLQMKLKIQLYILSL